MKTRLPRMSFNGRPYPPIPPDAKTLPVPIDDWFEQSERSAGPMPTQFSTPPSSQLYGRNELAQLPDSYFANAYAAPGHTSGMEYPEDPRNVGYGQHFSAWSPYCTYPNVQAMGYRAPILHPRHVQLPERPVTPHDTYRYPSSHTEHIYVSPAVEGPTKEALNTAFAHWYVDQVVDLLVNPGQFRPGVRGASDETWGLGGRERDGWLRVGRAPPDYSKPWGRMGMTSTPLLAARKIRQRRPETEPFDPWNILWNNEPKRSTTLVTFVLDMIQRMTISPIAIVSAIWFLTGLGLHDGDGQRGAELRDFLCEQSWSDLEAVEKRVTTLGLLLAGKSLDDNSFLSKSW